LREKRFAKTNTSYPSKRNVYRPLLDALSCFDNVIISFRGRLAEDLFFDRQTKATRQFPSELRDAAQRKLQYVNAAAEVADLRAPPGNRLEMLKGSLRGFYSIRINDQWRVIFRWDRGAHEVAVVDYH
jgi:proteic killer suppression protein